LFDGCASCRSCSGRAWACCSLARGFALRLTRRGRNAFGAAQRFARRRAEEFASQSSRNGTCTKTRVFAAKLAQLTGGPLGAHKIRALAGSSERRISESLPVAQTVPRPTRVRAGSVFVISPEIAAQHRDSWRVFFPLASRRSASRAKSVSSVQDQYVCASQKVARSQENFVGRLLPPRF